MLSVAGCSVAMANGDELLKQQVNLVTSRNDEAGVARALRKIFPLLTPK
jgi:hydroxymethylpyrimidine pyrophosphatase-like HAD family hydrolase